MLQELGSGRSSRQIAEAMGIAVRTVEAHRLSLSRKLGINGSRLLQQAARLLHL